MSDPNTARYDIPKSSAPLAPDVDSPTRVTLVDVRGLPHVARFARELASVYGEAALTMNSYADRLRVYVDESSIFGALIDSRLDLHALISETVRQLEQNARQEEPKRFTNAVSAVGVARLLCAASSKDGVAHPSPVYTDARGTTVLPNLSPQLFSGTVIARLQSRRDTFEIRGASFIRGQCVVQLNDEISDVLLSDDMEAEIASLPISCMRGALWFNGTVTRGADGVWFAEPGGEITVQQSVQDAC